METPVFFIEQRVKQRQAEPVNAACFSPHSIDAQALYSFTSSQQTLADRLQSALFSMVLYRIAQDDLLLLLLLFLPQIEICVLHCAHQHSESRAVHSACSGCISYQHLRKIVSIHSLLIAFEDT